MKRVLRRNTEITEIGIERRIAGGFHVGIATAQTNNGVGFVAFTIKSKMEAKNDPMLAYTVLTGRLRKALDQYRRGGRVNIKLTTLIPAKGM